MASARRVYRTQRTRQTGHPPGNTARWRASRLHLSRSSGADPPSGWVARCNAGHRPDHRENQVEAVEPFHGVMRRAVLCLRPREDKQFPCALAQPPSRSKLANLQHVEAAYSLQEGKLKAFRRIVLHLREQSSPEEAESSSLDGASGCW